jgi:hypothetical protein
LQALAGEQLELIRGAVPATLVIAHVTGAQSGLPDTRNPCSIQRIVLVFQMLRGTVNDEPHAGRAKDSAIV